MKAVLAIAGLSLRESHRQRLWIALAVAALALALVAPQLAAVDDAARLRLAVVAGGGAAGFVLTLLAALVPPQQMARDLDGRFALALFSRPVPRAAWLLGRWLGGVALLAAAAAALALALAAGLAVQGGTPAVRALTTPAAVEQLSTTGQAVPVSARATRLDGPAGNGLRCTFRDLPRPADGVELLVRVRVRALSPSEVRDTAVVTVVAAPSPTAVPRRLELDPGSPYGREAADGAVAVRDRGTGHRDLERDHLRLRLPATLIGDDGTTVVTLIRNDPSSTLTADEASVLVATPGGSFTANALRVALIDVGWASMVAAGTLAAGAVGGLGVALLAGLGLVACGHLLWLAHEAQRSRQTAEWLRRVLDLLTTVIPDANRFPAAAELAAGRTVGWDMVGAAWAYYGLWAAVLLVLGAWMLGRREL